MSEILSESEIYVYSKRYLRQLDWKLVGGEPPGGSNGLPRVEAKHPEIEMKGSKGSKKVDIIAYRDGYLLLLELKSTFDRGDIQKLDQLVGERRWRQSLVDACKERNALNRAGVNDSTLFDRMLSGDALVKGIGLGRHHQIPSEYVLFLLRSPTDIEINVGPECPIGDSYFS